MFTVHKFLITATSVIFIAFGLWLMLDPFEVEGLYPMTLNAPMAVSEIRAVFGGMMLGIGGAVLWLSLFVGRPRDAGMVMIIVLGGLISARIVGLFVEGIPDGPVLNETVFELVTLVLLCVTRRK